MRTAKACFWIVFTVTLGLLCSLEVRAADSSAVPTGQPSAQTVAAPQNSKTLPAADPVWEKLAAARRFFQIRLCELAIQRWPENRAYFTANRDLQLAYIERRSLVFYHLNSQEPERIVRNQGVDAFLNFSWSEDESASFSKRIMGYAGLSDEITRLKSAAEREALPKVLEDRFERMEVDPEYLALMRQTAQTIKQAERVLSSK